MPLSPQNSAVLFRARQANVEDTLASAKSFFSSSRWLALKNAYARDVAGEIARNNGSGAPQNGRHLSQYIATSTVLHCSDGWSFLGRSINAMLNGDEGASLHLAYYAELRAAMSLLGTQGVGVFKNRHYLINSTNSVEPFQGNVGTHEFVWDCLEAWAGTSSAADLIGDLIAPYGVTLTDWVSPFGPASIIRPSAQRWLKQWGMDLGKIKDDRTARNTASYRPYGIGSLDNCEADKSTAFVRSLWSILEHSGSSGFGMLDQYLLRSLLEQLVVSRHSAADLGGPNHLAIVNKVLNYQSLGRDISERYQDFLIRRRLVEEPLLFQHARRKPKPGPEWHFSVISRSVLLLRLATGATRNLFRKAGVDEVQLDFWRNQLGQQKGLWNGANAPSPISDIWADVDDNLNDFLEFENSPPAEKNFYNLTRIFGLSVCELGKFERIAVLNM